MKYLVVLVALIFLTIGVLIVGKQVYNAGYDTGRRDRCTPAPSTGVKSIDHSNEVVPRPNR